MILVTGGAGFIGGSLATSLTSQAKVSVLDIKSSADFPIDIRDRAAVRIAASNTTRIFHEAAMVSVPESMKNPEECFEINVRGTLHVLLAGLECGVHRVVAASSSAVYGNDPSLPKRETMLPDPVSPYAASKLAMEAMCGSFHQSFGLGTVALRYFNVYGPGQPATSPYAAVIPKFIEALVNSQIPKIYGDGSQTRDFVFVDDVVRANILASEAPSIDGQVFNIGSGAPLSLNDLLEIVAGILGVTPRAHFFPEREGDVRHSVADISKARLLLGFEPLTSIEDGLRQTVDWFIQESQ